MFLRASIRKKDGKEPQYWRIVENRRHADGRVLQRHVLDGMNRTEGARQRSHGRPRKWLRSSGIAM